MPYLGDLETPSPVYSNNVFELDLVGASFDPRPLYAEGRVRRGDGYVRDGRRLPLDYPFEFWVDALQRRPNILQLNAALLGYLQTVPDERERAARYVELMPALDALIQDGWVRASNDPSLPRFNEQFRDALVHPHRMARAESASR